MDPSDYMKDPRPPAQTQLSTSLPGLRTFVTTTNPDSGKAEVQSTRDTEWGHFDDKKMAMSVQWTNTFPSDLNEEKDVAGSEETISTGKLGLVRPNGVVCRVVDLKPGYECMMHRTKSLDYGIVIEGTVEMKLDDGSVSLLRRGDIAVQRATMHSWRNPSENEWTRMIFVLQDIGALSVGGKNMGEDLSEGGDLIPPSGNE